MAHGLAFSSLAALAPRMLVLRISRRSLSLAPRNAIKYPVFYYLGPGSRYHPIMTELLATRELSPSVQRAGTQSRSDEYQTGGSLEDL